VAYLPPDALRLEIYPPVGGARLIVTGDGAALVALAPQERRFETLDPHGEGLKRLVGVALDGRAFISLLSGGSPCPREAGNAEPPEACTTAKWRFERVAPAARADEAESAARFAGPRGETLLSVEYRKGRIGARGWPEAVRFVWPDREVAISLTLRQGPGGGDSLDIAAFHAVAPPGFVAGPVLEDATGSPWLLPEGGASGESRP
jgi:hypothetical protein